MSPNGAMAKKYGVTTKKVVAVGGAEKLQALSEEIRRYLLASHHYGTSGTVINGGLAKRGFKCGKRSDEISY